MDVDNKNTLDIFSEEFLRCDICQEQLNTPKELPCLHYFCCDCLKGLVRASGLASGGVFACPTCRGEATVPEGGVKAFPTNFHVVRLEKMIKERRKARKKKPNVQLVTALSAMQETISKAKEARDMLKRRFLNLHKHKLSCKQEIQLRKQYLHSLIDSYVESMNNEVDDAYNGEMKELTKNLEKLEKQISSLQQFPGITYTDPKYSPLQRLKTQLDKVTKFAGNLSSLEETVMEVSTTNKTTFKSGTASAYIMEKVFGTLKQTSLSEDSVLLQRKLSLADIDEGENTTVVNYFSCTMPTDEYDCYITDIEVLPSGEIVCLDADNHTGKIFFESGQPKLEFGKSTLKRPDKVTCLVSPNTTADGPPNYSILISDLEEECIFRFDKNGVLGSRFPSPVNNPAAVSATKDGNVLITDWKTKTVHIVSGTGEHLHTFPTDLTWPVYATACPDNGNVVVSDWKSHHVRIFDTFGTRVRDYNTVGSGPEELHRPNGVFCDQKGNLYLADMRNNRIHLLTSNGSFKKFVATNEQGVKRPTGITMNSKGQLLVCDLKGTVIILSLASNNAQASGGVQIAQL